MEFVTRGGCADIGGKVNWLDDKETTRFTDIVTRHLGWPADAIVSNYVK